MMKYFAAACDFNVKVPIENNLSDLTAYTKQMLSYFSTSIRGLRGLANEFYANEAKRSDESIVVRKRAMLIEWQDNLKLLNTALNRRVGTLKGMECDLEETIRLSMIQQEAEATVFEQSTCAKLEEFSIDWRR